MNSSNLTTRFWPAWTAGVYALAFAVRLVDIKFNFDNDEIFSVTLVSGSLKKMLVGSLLDQTHPPLYNLLLHIWVSIWGISEVGVRLLSALLAAGAITIYFQIIRTRVRALSASMAAFVMCFSGFLIYYGQEGRPYALISFIGAANLLAFLHVLKTPADRTALLCWAASALALVYAQYFGAIYLAVEGSVLLFCLPLRIALRALAPAVLASLCVLPWMWMAFHQHWALSEISWIDKPALRSLPDFFLATIGWPPVISGWLLLVALTSVALVGFSRLIGSKSVSREVVLFAAIAFVPPIVAFLLSYLLGVSIWAPRQLITSAFAFIILISILVDALSPPSRRLVVVAIIAWAFVGSADGFTRNRVPHYADIFANIKRSDPRAAVLAEEDWTLRSLLFYGPAANVPIFDLRTKNLSFRGPSYYYVCRPNNCSWLNPLERRFGYPSDVLRYPWNTAGWRPRDAVVVYHFKRDAQFSS